LSYSGYEDICHQLYWQRLESYWDAMADLYDVHDQDRDDTIDELKTEMMCEDLTVEVAIIRMVNTGANQLAEPGIIVKMAEVANASPELEITVRRGHTHCQYSCDIEFDQLVEFRQNDEIIHIKLVDSYVQGFQEFQITWRQIHAEGFEDWVDFGNGVKLLVKITMEVADEDNITQEQISVFHLQTLEYMITKRTLALRQTPAIVAQPIGTEHRESAAKYKVSYLRPKIIQTVMRRFGLRRRCGRCQKWPKMSHPFTQTIDTSI
jgi:hypothetical protein